MADPNILVLADDIRFEDRGGAFALVDPTRPAGRRDVAVAWPEGRRWRWRMTDERPTGTPHPVCDYRDDALSSMLSAYAARETDVPRRLAEQRPRFSFGEPQILRAA